MSLMQILTPEEGYRPTHKELVVRAERWLRGTRGCSVVLTELVTHVGEIPDAIGWKGHVSTLIECKTSKADFFRDALKTSRKADHNMGQNCYYMTRPGLLSLSDLPPYWGLLEVGPRSVRILKKAHTRPIKNESDFACAYIRQFHEIAMLVSALRRIK